MRNCETYRKFYWRPGSFLEVSQNKVIIISAGFRDTIAACGINFVFFLVFFRQSESFCCNFFLPLSRYLSVQAMQPFNPCIQHSMSPVMHHPKNHGNEPQAATVQFNVNFYKRLWCGLCVVSVNDTAKDIKEMPKRKIK